VETAVWDDEPDEVWSGKWLVGCDAGSPTWEAIKRLVLTGGFVDLAKVSSPTRPRPSPKGGMACVYTNDHRDLDDVGRVLGRLRGVVPGEWLSYKADADTEQLRYGADGPLTSTFASLVGAGSWVDEGRLILLVSLPDAPRDVAEVGEGHPAGVREAAKQVQRRNAEWFWVPPLTAAALERLLAPVEPEVADYVARYSHDDLSAMALWEALVRDGAVTRDGGAWTATEDLRTWAGRRIEETLASALDNDTDRIRRLYALLRHGAVQGSVFCGESAARAALEGLSPGFDRSLHADRALDQLIDDLDELADAHPTGLLQPATQLGRDEQGTVWEYRFTSPWLPSWLETTLPVYDRLVYPQRLFDQLVVRHRTNGLFDADVARLARHAGHHDIAALYRGRVDTRQRLAALGQQAQLLLAAPRGMNNLDPYLPTRLTETAEELLHVGDSVAAVACARAAVDLTDRSHQADGSDDTRRDLAVTLHTLGQALLAQGAVDEAVEQLRAAHSHDQALYAAQSTPAARRGLAVTLHELGRALLAQGAVDEACGRWQQAQEHAAAAGGARVAMGAAALLAEHCHPA